MIIPIVIPWVTETHHKSPQRKRRAFIPMVPMSREQLKAFNGLKETNHLSKEYLKHER